MKPVQPQKGAMSHKNFFLLRVALVMTLAPALSVGAESLTLGTATNVSFASVEAGRTILTTRDEFVAALSPFDRAARMKTPRDVPEKEFLEFVGRSVRAWAPDETNQIAAIIRGLAAKPGARALPLPSSLIFIKTSGEEEGRASDTRQNAVILPEPELRSRDLDRTVAHELFHVLSRHNPSLRTNLYRILGFNPINSVTLPEEFRERKLTNPDGVQNGWFINVTNRGRALPVIPVLYASTNHYDPVRGGEFFQYLVFKFMVVTQANGSWSPRLADGRAELLDPRNAQGFFEQVGRNTQYIIHPDEILADNFVRLINGETNPPTPRIIAEMQQVFDAGEPPRK